MGWRLAGTESFFFSPRIEQLKLDCKVLELDLVELVVHLVAYRAAEVDSLSISYLCIPSRHGIY